MNESAAAYAGPTALEAALDRVGDRWSLLVVDALLDGPRRFGELREALPGIAANILTDRLRRLERERILVSAPYSTRPPRMEYTLTGDGRDFIEAKLGEVVTAMKAAHPYEEVAYDIYPLLDV